MNELQPEIRIKARRMDGDNVIVEDFELTRASLANRDLPPALNTEERYRELVDRMVHAVELAANIVCTVSDAELRWIRETIARSDAMGMFLVPPIAFPKAMDNLAQQRRLLKIVGQLRAWAKDNGLEAAVLMEEPIGEDDNG